MAKLNDFELNKVAAGVEITYEERNPDATDAELEMKRLQTIVDRRDESYQRIAELLSKTSDTTKKNI